MRRRGARLPTALAALALAASPLAAQTPPPRPAATPAAQPAPEPPPPYEPQLLRLAEITGALSYLRDLCGEGDGATFRAKFASLLETEGNTPERKETLAGAFNRGFHDYELTYRACTPAAHVVVSHYLDEAVRIAKDIASRYGG